MSFRSKFSALAIAAALGATAFASAPLTAQAAYSITLSKGDSVNAVMNGSLDSGTAQVGDRFTMRVVSPYPEDDQDLANAVINGEVIKVTPAGQGRNPELDLSFNTITLQNGTSYPLEAQMTGGGPKQQTRNGGHVALTTIGGMVLGNILGKTILHTNVGGAAGAAGGFLIGYNKKSNVALTQGTSVSLTLTRPLVVRRQASHY
ncbi:MAG TPA: hypothetical protein VIG32_01105 [Candidatus Baltobacteraceae bacterium]|jgi:hypothetical protein